MGDKDKRGRFSDKSSDKRVLSGQSDLLGDLDLSLDSLADPTHALGHALITEHRLFGIFSVDQVQDLLAKAGILKHLKRIGFQQIKVELDILSDMDNRIFVRTHDDRVLLHFRLKIARLPLLIKSPRKINIPDREFFLLYIDWLLAQNPERPHEEDTHKLFPGQEYPGLGVYRQIKQFITLLAVGLECDAVLNSPEFFHDAVLFHDKFFFIDPYKEGMLKALLDLRRASGISLRDLSWLIVNHRLYYASDLELPLLPPDQSLALPEPDASIPNGASVFVWPYGEMLSPQHSELSRYTEGQSYIQQVEEARQGIHFYPPQNRPH